MSVESFGYKHGLPLDADIVLDVRFLPNPHWEDDLKPLTGHDPKVRDYVLETAAGSRFVESFDGLLVDYARSIGATSIAKSVVPPSLPAALSSTTCCTPKSSRPGCVRDAPDAWSPVHTT